MLTIGQISKICGVSVKTLRHYDKIGLLKPKQADTFTGYRYYDESQIGIMLLIGRYKRYGLSLTEIQELLAITDEQLLMKRLLLQRSQLARQADHLSITMRELEAHLEQFERTGDVMSYQSNYKVEIVNSQELVLLTTRNNMSVEDFGKFYGKLYEKIAREHLEVNGVVAAIYHDREFDPAFSDIELAVGIVDRDKATRILPSTLCAKTTHVGPYSNLHDAYGAIVTWIQSNGYEMDGMPYDVYVKTQFDKVPPQEWVTDIYFPVKKN